MICDLTVIEKPEEIAAFKVKELVGAKCRFNEMKENTVMRLKELKDMQEIEKPREDTAVFSGNI